MFRHASFTILALWLCATSAVNAADFFGHVVSVLDGDTIEVLTGHHTERIPLSGIDCPEKGQAYGQKAKHAASALVFGKEVTLQTHVDADQPMDLLLSSSPPGTIYIATTPGEPTVRLFATVLPQEMSDTASWLQSSFGRPGSFVLSLSASGTVRHISPTSAPRGRTEYP